MRKAFSLITAIFVMLIMATVAAFILNLSGKITQESTAQYRKEQAALLARSYTELAVMAVINHERNATTPGTCIEDINGAINGLIPGGPVTGSSTGGSGYNVMTRIYYLGNNLPCSQSRRLNDSTTHSATVITSNYNNTGASDALAGIIVDVYVQYKDPDAQDPNNSSWITYRRRTLQKI